MSRVRREGEKEWRKTGVGKKPEVGKVAGKTRVVTNVCSLGWFRSNEACWEVR